MRNRRRSLLSIVGLAFGVGVGLVALSWVGGQEPMAIAAAAEGGIGHVRIAPGGWGERRDDALRLEDGERALAAVRGLPGVELAVPRARMGALLGLGTRSSHVPLTGVDPAIEPTALRYVRDVSRGRYLEPGEIGAIVLGHAIAARLGAELEDELVVTAVDLHGEMQSALLVVVGIVETGSRVVDSSIAHVSLEDLASLSGRPSIAEITMLLDDAARVPELRPAIQAIAGRNEVLAWDEVAPELRARLAAGRVFTNLAIGIVLLVVLLGVASAQLTGVLERRKEFAVLAALGMRSLLLVRVVVTEGVLLGTAGAMGALGWAVPLLHRWSTVGINLAEMVQTREGIAMGGVLIDPIYHPAFGLWLAPSAFALSLIATVVASLYPAWFASRTDPASALRVDR